MSMTIGEVIDTLERAKPDAPVWFAFGYCVPTDVDSWRGVYAEPALGHVNAGRGSQKQPPTVADILKKLKEAIDGRTFSGWKGGDYSYSRSDTLHVDNPGEYSNTELIRVQVEDWRVTLHTAKED